MINLLFVFYSQMITMDEKWCWHDNSRAVRHWRLKGSREESTLKTPKPSIHSKKKMIIVFWDMLGVVHHEYLPKGQTINADFYIQVLNRLKIAIDDKRPFLARSKIFIQQDNARPHVAKDTKKKFADLGWELLPHPPYSPDLAPSDYHLFSRMAARLKNKVFADEDQLIDFVDQFLFNCENEGTFFSRGIEKLPSLWNKCISAGGNYFD